MENSTNSLLIAYYGDDFTGSTDALEFLSRAGIKTMLFIEAPTLAQLKNYPDLQAIGVAGMSRTMSPIEMERVLTPAFADLQKLNPKHVHYKVCSTFDSSPAIGSIGKAIDIGAAIFKSKFVPVLVAAPILGRHMLFGNLFARMGIGSAGAIYRLDRHPSMSKHPVTPADESDIRLRLAKQTEKNIDLFNILDLHQYQEEPKDLEFAADIVLFDALEQQDLASIGEIIDAQANEEDILFSAGSSGIEMALGAYWQQSGLLKSEQKWEIAKVDGPILIASGSCSAVTSTQISFALHKGFAEVAIDTITLAKQVSSSSLTENINYLNEVAKAYATKAVELIQKGKSIIIHTSLGNDDERVIETDKVFIFRSFSKSTTAKLYGALLGKIAILVTEKTSLKRIIVAGGDTSSYAARAMGIEAVEMIAPLSPGSPLCKAHAPNTAINHLQIAFKGGQVGKEDFFLTAAKDIEPNQT
ncbi:four-carbon acid sugar kinase family protein [Pedobacter frigiditerrae]|uniref:Four-carbon acid sugar kinase family protein n=1 Tax=Pedobacter frigiditerrae TaxID=2530452 RepID=A0A4R0MSP7_9SPHI|nr:four-carbon acid sugar kinase family protein [Pedobacter frigiditerrae]TCC90039.1 four-carbon acid sugar kinase family protein [Pedobacter frigiditerrae]